MTKWHFEDRIAANGEHPSYEDVKDNEEWRLLPREESRFHIDDEGEDELKYIHSDGREAVFNGDTLLPMTNSKYMATYDYFVLYEIPKSGAVMEDYIKFGISYVGHGTFDVAPYGLFGCSNTREEFEAKVISIFE